jgi:hypothetical protein
MAVIVSSSPLQITNTDFGFKRDMGTRGIEKKLKADGLVVAHTGSSSKIAEKLDVHKLLGDERLCCKTFDKDFLEAVKATFKNSFFLSKWRHMRSFDVTPLQQWLDRQRASHCTATL